MIKHERYIINDESQKYKADAGKPRMELIPPSTLISIGKILTYGAAKYGERSWKNVERQRYLGALLRHLTAYMSDPNSVDDDSGYLHIEHVLCNAVFLNDMRGNDISENEDEKHCTLKHNGCGEWECSGCGYIYTDDYDQIADDNGLMLWHYCPDCGAKIDGSND